MYPKIKVTIIFLLLFTSCNTSSDHTIQLKRTVINGKILDYHDEYDDMPFWLPHLIDDSRTLNNFSVLIAGDGSFYFDTLLAFPQEIWNLYGQFFCEPGDSIFIEIERSIIKEVRGTAAQVNNELVAFLKVLPTYKYGGKSHHDSIKYLQPDEYQALIQRREREYRDSLEAFMKETHRNSKFYEWANDIIQYGSWCDLLRYPWLRKGYLHSPQADIELPDTYYSFLETYDMNDFSYLSKNHILFLHELFMYCYRNPPDSLNKAYEFFTKGDTSTAMQMILRMITDKTSGLTQELLLTKYYYSLLKGKNLELFRNYCDSTLITNDYFLWELQKEFEIAASFLANQSPTNANIKEYSHIDDVQFLNTIIKNYPNKVIYIDFWAPWCAPCIREMSYSKELQNYFKDDDIIFLYLGNQCTKEQWQAAIGNYNLDGEHILLTDAQYKYLSGEFGINGIPHYAIINNKGQVVSKDAIRPSNDAELRVLLQKLCDEYKP